MPFRKLLLLIPITVILFEYAAAGPPRRVSGFNEIVNPTLQVSGHYVAGFMTPGSTQGPNPTVMSVWLYSPHDRLCVSVRTVDGYYEATAEFDTSTSARGVHLLDFGSEKKDVFTKYGPDELILKGRVGTDCAKPEALSEVPMAWGRADQTPTTYILYVNTDGLDAEIVFPKPGNPREVTRFICSKITTRFKRRVYDARCVITSDNEIDGTKARIELSRYGEAETWKPLSLLFADDL